MTGPTPTWDVEPPMREARKLGYRSPVGKRFGAFVVLGEYAGDSNKQRQGKGGTRWVAQCSCGRYEVLKLKTVRDGSHKACNKCQGEYKEKWKEQNQ